MPEIMLVILSRHRSTRSPRETSPDPNSDISPESPGDRTAMHGARERFTEGDLHTKQHCI